MSEVRPEKSRPADALLSQLRSEVEATWWPSATEMDRTDKIPASRLDVLRTLGLFGMAAPSGAGGLGLDGPTARMVLRILSGACGATAFMFAQHHGAVGALVATDNAAVRERWLNELIAGALAGTAYAHVRRAKQPVVSAVDQGNGSWRFNGVAPWATSWGTAAVYSVAATSDDGRLVWALLDTETPGLTCPDPLELMVFKGTGTVRMQFDDVIVGPDAVLSVAPLDEWRARDRFLAVRPSPLALGIGDRALALLYEQSPEVGEAFDADWAAVSDEAERQCALVDNRSAELERVAAVRAAVVLKAQQLTTALLSLGGGRAAELENPAQRLAREAMFYVVQAQNDDGRAAMLAALTNQSDPSPLP